MTLFAFFDLLFGNIELFLCCMIPTLFVFIILANKLGNSWMNPILFNVLNAGIGIGVAIFLFMTGNATEKTFTYVIFSSIIYWSILLWKFPKRIGTSKMYISGGHVIEARLFYVLYFFSIVSTLFSYSKFGIPLFNTINSDDFTRMDTYTNSGGWGLILRLSDFPKAYCFFYILNKLYAKSFSIIKVVLLVLPFVIFGVLSASRSSFLFFLFSFWGYKLFYKDNEVKLSDYKKFASIAIAVILLTFAIEHATDASGAMYSFAERVIASGDLYWYALPDDLWKSLTVTNPWADIFVGLLAPLRLMSSSEADRCLGFQLTELVYNWNLSSGPVELFPISSLAYFGYTGGLVMVVFQALITCYIYSLCFRKSYSLISAAFLFYCFNTCVFFLGSLRDSTGQLFNILASLIFLFLILFLIGGLKK